MYRGIAALLTLLVAGGCCGAQERPATEMVQEGLAKLKARQIPEAEKSFRAVLSMPELSLTTWERAEAHRGLGQILNIQGKYPDARKELDEALRLHQTTGDRAALGNTYSSLGYNDWGFGRRERAREQYEKALIEYEAAGDIREKATTLYNLTFIPRTNEEKLELLPRSLQAARDLGDRRLEGKNLHLWSDTLYSAGQYRQAYDLLEQALTIFREDASSKFELARALTSMGRLYRTHNHDDHAIELYGQALAVQEDLGDRQGVAQSLRSIALTQLDLGEIEKAKETFAKAIEAAKTTGSESVRSMALVGLGQAYVASGEHEQALAYLEQAYRTFGEKQNGNLNVLLARSYLALGRPADAEKAAAEAIRLAPRYGDAEALLGGHYVRARALEELGDRDGAAANLQEALAVYEKMRANLLPADFLKRGYSGKSAGLFQYGVGLLHRAGRAPETLAVAEQARARAFLDLLATRELQRRAASLPHPPPAGSKSVAESASLSHTEPDSAADDVPDLRSLASAPSVTTDEYRDAARQMNSTIVSYWADTKALYIWTVPPDGPIHAARVEVTPERLRELIARTGAWSAEGAARNGGAAARGLTTRSGAQVTAAVRSRAAWRDLYKLLIEPVRAHLPQGPGSLVTVVPHGPLFRVPFAGLMDGKGRYLVEDYSLNTVPSVALLRFRERWRTSGQQAGREYLLVSDPRDTPTGPSGNALPPLPGARKEAEEIVRVLGPAQVTSLNGKAATETAVKAALRGVKVVHLATHGILLDDQPFDSFLVLGSGPKASGDDGRLTAREIYDLRLNADLVVLSACSTALGQVTGDGIVGLTRAFFYAGTPSIIATLWDVADEPTQQLVSEFYRAYRGGATRSGALRAAQLRLLSRLRQGRVSVKTPLGEVKLPEDPMLWAGVALLGEP